METALLTMHSFYDQSNRILNENKTEYFRTMKERLSNICISGLLTNI